MPSKPAALLKLKVTPLGRAKTSRPILTPRSPFPSVNQPIKITAR